MGREKYRCSRVKEREKPQRLLGWPCAAIGRGYKVFMVQFLKAPNTSGEQIALQSLAPMIIIKPMGRKGFIFRRGCEPQDVEMAKRALEEARSAMLSGAFDVIVLDEVNVAIHLGLIDVKDVLDLMNSKPDNVELVLTGRYARPEIIDRADVVSEMKKIKHHFDEGVKARNGIEY